jgi:hypothetical protein
MGHVVIDIPTLQDYNLQAHATASWQGIGRVVLPDEALAGRVAHFGLLCWNCKDPYNAAVQLSEDSSSWC